MFIVKRESRQRLEKKIQMCHLLSFVPGIYVNYIHCTIFMMYASFFVCKIRLCDICVCDCLCVCMRVCMCVCVRVCVCLCVFV